MELVAQRDGVRHLVPRAGMGSLRSKALRAIARQRLTGTNTSWQGRANSFKPQLSPVKQPRTRRDQVAQFVAEFTGAKMGEVTAREARTRRRHGWPTLTTQ